MRGSAAFGAGDRLGTKNEKRLVAKLLQKALSAAAEYRPQRLLADAGYDTEWIHRVCREDWGVQSFIKPIVYRKDGLLGGRWRSQMTPQRLKRQGMVVA